MELGRYILSALELLIVSDIIHTALSLALADLLFLGILVLIRSMISFFLNREIREIGGSSSGEVQGSCFSSRTSSGKLSATKSITAVTTPRPGRAASRRWRWPGRERR